MRPAYHSIMVHLATGPLVLAFLAATFRFWFRPRKGAVLKLWNACDDIVLYAAIFGLLTMIASFATGILLRPLEAFLNSPISKNKILIASMSIVFWGTWLVMRFRAGPGLWEMRSFIGHYAYLAIFAGTMFLMAGNSIGGDLAGSPSGYEYFAMSIGLRTRHALYFPSWLNTALWISGVLAVVFALQWRVRKRSESV